MKSVICSFKAVPDSRLGLNQRINAQHFLLLFPNTMFDMKLNRLSIVLAVPFGLLCVCFLTQTRAQTPLQPQNQVDAQDSVRIQEDDPAAMEDQHFTLKVLPLLKSKCLGCHGAAVDDIKGEFDVRTRADLLSGGESGDPGVIPGDVDASTLIQAVRWDGLEMPPKENDRLTPEQVAVLERWVAVGAPWPDEKRQRQILAAERLVAETEEGVLVTTSGGLSDTWTYRRYDKRDVWAFQPLRETFQFDSIDAFINARLSEAKLSGAPQAEPRDLIRRVTLDLTGLPPTADQINRFLKGWKADPELAWGNLVDRLLASPQYGERWAQHWLDVVRYADTAGFSNDYERSNAWRYRDYVIRAFNEDKPFEEFVLQQIAGDEFRPEDSESLIATSFLRMGPWGTAMVPQDEARQLYRDDVVHSIGQSFLSIPMRCCKCHDHKFDPIPTRDYYRLYAALAGTQPAELSAAFLPEENKAGFRVGQEIVDRLYAFADGKRQALVDKREAAAKAWYKEHDLPYKNVNARRKDPEDQKPPRHVGLSEMEKGRLKVREQDVWIWERRQERYQPMVQSVFNGPDQNQNGRKLRKPAKFDTKWKPTTHIFTGGDYQAIGESVSPGVLSACGVSAPDGTDQDPFAIGEEIHGRRLALAKWIADKKNPLSTRSFVNRIWQHHFGTGIVGTANNFGAKGAPPSHPELLDWLASQFLANGGRSKPLHRLIVMSQAYRRSSKHPEPQLVKTIDPTGQLLASFRPRRLTAEELRDAILLVTGELNPEMGGVPVMPEINLEVALEPRMIQFSIAPAYQPSRTPHERNRRSIYAYRVRGQADPFMEVMNLPNPNESCEVRDVAAVSPQAFTLMNSDVMTDRSIAFAKHLQAQHAGTKLQVTNAFELAYGRQPRSKELSSLTNYVEDMVKYHRQHKPESTVYPTSVTRSLVEEFTGETFTFDEILPVFEDYVPDTKPANVSAETRALADLAMLLFNSNEFVYVY